MVQPLWRTVWRYLRNLHIELPYDPAIPLLGIYTTEYYSAIKKNKLMPFAATWMEPETLILSEVRQKEKDKHRIISLISQI